MWRLALKCSIIIFNASTMTLGPNDPSGDDPIIHAFDDLKLFQLHPKKFLLQLENESTDCLLFRFVPGRIKFHV